MLIGVGEERRHAVKQEQNDTAKTVFGLILAILTAIAIVF